MGDDSAGHLNQTSRNALCTYIPDLSQYEITNTESNICDHGPMVGSIIDFRTMQPLTSGRPNNVFGFIIHELEIIFEDPGKKRICNRHYSLYKSRLGHWSLTSLTIFFYLNVRYKFREKQGSKVGISNPKKIPVEKKTIYFKEKDPTLKSGQ